MGRKGKQPKASDKKARRPLIMVFPTNRPETTKLSEILLTIISPLSAHIANPLEDLEEAEAMLHFGSTIWNISRLSNARERRSWARRFAKNEAGATGADARDLGAFFTELVEMARSVWPDDGRIIEDAWVYPNEAGEAMVKVRSAQSESVVAE